MRNHPRGEWKRKLQEEEGPQAGDRRARGGGRNAPSKRHGPQRRFLPVADANAYLRAKQLAGAAARDMRSPSAAAWPLLKQLKQRPPQLRFA